MCIEMQILKNKRAPVNTLNTDTFANIAKFLDLRDLGRLSVVYTVWEKMLRERDSLWEPHIQKIGIDPGPFLQLPIREHLCARKKFQVLQALALSKNIRHARAKDVFINPYPREALGRLEWIEKIGDPGVPPPLPTKIWEVLNRPCRFWPQEKVSATHLLILVPKIVTRPIKGSFVNVPMTLRKIEALMKEVNHLRGISEYNQIWKALIRCFGDVPIEKSYWMLITKKPIPESIGKSITDQQRLASRSFVYAIPKIIEVLIAILLNKGPPIFCPEQKMETRCREMVKVFWQSYNDYGHSNTDTLIYRLTVGERRSRELYINGNFENVGVGVRQTF